MVSLVEKGVEGELRVTKALEDLGFQVLRFQGAVYSGGGQFYNADAMACGKGRSFFVQVKHKNPRRYYADTGLEEWRFTRYCNFAKKAGLPMLLLFTDDTMRVYGNWIDKLWVDRVQDEIVYFDVTKLKDLKELVS